MEKKSRGKNIIIIILVLIVLGFGGFIVYDKIIVEDETAELNKQVESLKKEISDLNKSKEADDSNNKINSIVGEYSYTKNNPNGSSLIITVDFMEDGTYYEKIAGTSASIIYGTYIIDNNKITLNQLFNHNNELANGERLNETYNSVLNNDGTISWTNSLSDQEKIVLTKNGKQNDVKTELMKWLMNDVEEYNKSLTN